jgi:hypothetical protein
LSLYITLSFAHAVAVAPPAGLPVDVNMGRFVGLYGSVLFLFGLTIRQACLLLEPTLQQVF